MGVMMQHTVLCLFWEKNSKVVLLLHIIGVGVHVFVYCQMVFCLGQGRWDIWWHFGVYFSWGFWWWLTNLSMRCLWIATLALAVMVMKGLVFHPLFYMVLLNEFYLICVCVKVWSGKLSWQYMNSLIWIVYMGEGAMGVCIWFGAPNMHRMSNFNLAWHWHVVCGHVNLRSPFWDCLFRWFVTKVACIG